MGVSNCKFFCLDVDWSRVEGLEPKPKGSEKAFQADIWGTVFEVGVGSVGKESAG